MITDRCNLLTPTFVNSNSGINIRNVCLILCKNICHRIIVYYVIFQRIISIICILFSNITLFAGRYSQAKSFFKKKNQKEMFYDFDQSWTIFLHIKFLYLDPKIIRVILIHRDLKLSLESFLHRIFSKIRVHSKRKVEKRREISKNRRC